MKKFYHKLVILLLILICISIRPSFSLASVDTSKKIYDYSQLFNDSEKNNLYNTIISNISNYNIDIAIVTTNDNTTSIEDYAKNFFSSNNFGFTNNKNGIILIMNTMSNSTYVYANGNALNIFSDTIINNINENICSYFLEEQYFKAAYSFLNDVSNYCSDNKTNISNNPLGKFYSNVNTSEKIYDYVGVLTETQKQDLYKLITEYIDDTNCDMVVVIINDNPRKSSMNFADDFYDYNNFGLDNQRSGILFLLDLDTSYSGSRHTWISTTGKCIGIYTDYKIDKILDAIHSNLSGNINYYKASKAFINKTSHYYNTSGSGDPKYYYNDNGEMVYNTHYISWGMVIFSSICFTIIFLAFSISSHKTVKKATKADFYSKNANITDRYDQFSHTHTTKVYDPPSSSSSSSSGGGFSSTHTSSSGSSHGGGGRSF